MKKTVKRKLTLSKKTVASLEAGKLLEAAGGDETDTTKYSDLWPVTTCMAPAD